MRAINTIKHIHLITIYIAVLAIVGLLITSDNLLGLKTDLGFFLSKAIEVLAIWGLYELGRILFYKDLLPVWFIDRVNKAGEEFQEDTNEIN